MREEQYGIKYNTTNIDPNAHINGNDNIVTIMIIRIALLVMIVIHIRRRRGRRRIITLIMITSIIRLRTIRRHNIRKPREHSAAEED